MIHLLDFFYKIVIFSGSPTYQTDRAVLFFTSSIRAKDALNQHPLPALLHLGKVLLIWHNHQRSLPKSSKSETRFYQTELASTAVKTLKEVMEDTEAPASARIAAARTSLELAGDIGKHSQSQRNYEQNLAEMTPEELSAIFDRWEDEKSALAKDITPVW